MAAEREDVSLSAAEHHLRACWQQAQACTLGNGDLPPERAPDETRSIRADWLRGLLDDTGDDTELHLQGAMITGSLCLTHQSLRKRLHFDNCRFDEIPDLSRATIAALVLNGCALPGLVGYQLTVTGDFHLRHSEITGPCRLDYAQFGTGVDLTGSRFSEGELSGTDDRALSLQGSRITLSLIAPDIRVTGFCDLINLQIGCQLQIIRASFDSGAAETALRLQQLRVGDALFWQKITVKKGRVLFAHARTQVLVDDPESWAACGTGLELDGFRYDSIPGRSLGQLADRLAWLEQGTTAGGSFCSQPWQQFASLLRDGGDDAAARQVMMAREALYIRHERHRMRGRIAALWRGTGSAKRKTGTALRDRAAAVMALPAYAIHGLWSAIKRVGIGYGYDPRRPLYWTVALVCLGWVLADYGWQQGVFTPAATQILVSDDWRTAMQVNAAHPTAEWLTTQSARHYEEFSPFLFALDTYLPVMDLGQEKAWGLTTGTPLGWWGRALWVALQAAGWIVTSLGIAAVAGLVQKGLSD